MCQDEHSSCQHMRIARHAIGKQSPLSFGSGTKFTTKLRLMRSHPSVCSSTSMIRKSCSIMDGCRLRRSIGVVVTHDEHDV